MIRQLRTETIPLTELTPFPGNARRGRVEAIRESLRVHGQYRALVVRRISDSQLIILAGNHTYLAMNDHGPGTCAAGAEGNCALCADGWPEAAWCGVIECDDASAVKINLADNRTAEFGTYDSDALAQLLLRVEDDYEGSGFTEEDVSKILESVQERTPEPAAPPEEFKEYDEDIETEHTCPKCGYEWSGGK